MSITFSYLEGAASVDAVRWRGAASRAYAYLLYSRLGDLYVEKQRYQDAAATYRAFVGRDPDNDHAPDLAMQAIEAYTKGGFTDLVLDGKREYVAALRFRRAVLEGPQRSGLPGGGQGAARPTSGCRHVLPRRRAEIQDAGGLRSRRRTGIATT